MSLCSSHFCLDRKASSNWSSSCWFLLWFTLQSPKTEATRYSKNVGWLSKDYAALYLRNANS
jgi:hypothetical protein